MKERGMRKQKEILIKLHYYANNEFNGTEKLEKLVVAHLVKK
jgi:hypothetical protein